MEIYLKLVDVFFPVFLVIGIGFYFGKKNPKFDTDFIHLHQPALILKPLLNFSLIK